VLNKAFQIASGVSSEQAGRDRWYAPDFFVKCLGMRIATYLSPAAVPIPSGKSRWMAVNAIGKGKLSRGN